MIVRNVNNGKIVNKLLQKWERIESEEMHKAWELEVQETKFGTYGTVRVSEYIERNGIERNTPANQVFIKEVRVAENKESGK